MEIETGTFTAGDLYDWHVQGEQERDWRVMASSAFVAGVAVTLIRYKVLDLPDDYKGDVVDEVLVNVKRCVEGDVRFREDLASTMVCNIIELMFRKHVNLPPHLEEAHKQAYRQKVPSDDNST